MTIVDHFFVLMLFAVQPALSTISNRRYLRRIEEGRPPVRISIYRWTGISQWLFLATLTGFWYWHGRPFSDLGFVAVGGGGFYIGVLLIAAVCTFLIYTWRQVSAMTDDEKAKQARALGSLVYFLPRNEGELRAFFRLSITAGIVEEIAYRGFAIWYLGLIMPIWGAVLVSSIFFGLGHSYQGANGAIRTGLVGAAFGALYLLTGSIWLPIIAHILLDALQGLSIVEVLRQRGSGSTAATSNEMAAVKNL